jgi:2',3'-cyclic-nucleotide 2'-phosphodiesterase / 3'-nucleotidase
MPVLLALLILAAGARAEQVTITLLATTDLHGNIYPVDYFTDRPAARGLAKIATLLREERLRSPHSLLIDCGDTIQGSPLETVYQTYVHAGHLPLNLAFAGKPLEHDPMMLAMNQLGYDAMTVGNHEFNFGLKNLQQARADARFPWISANIEVAAGGAEKPFAPYIVKTVDGVKVAVIGLTTAAIPLWEKPENIGAYRFTSMPRAAEKAVAELRRVEHPDLVVVAAHAGLERGRTSDAASGGADNVENMVYQVAAEVPGIDAIVFGHTHSELAEYHVGKVLLAQPKNWGISLARLDFVMDKAPDGRWKVEKKESRLLPARAATPADESLMELARPYEELAERYLNTGVAESDKAMDGRLGRVEDTPLMDAVHTVQLYYAKADVSFAALFNPRVRVPKGPVTVRQLAALYVYDNELYAIEGTGKMVKDALENAARYFLSCHGESCRQGPLINRRVIGFNFDTAEGVDYEIDLTRPAGDRIRNLRFRGRPLAPDQKLRIAVNSYRAAGSAGYSMFRGAKIVWRSILDVRDLMIQYYTERKQLPVTADDNWSIVPAEARQTLQREALAEGTRSVTR